MRTDAAAISGVADHDVVDAPAGYEAEVIQHRAHPLMPLIDGLNQQAPVGLREVPKVLFGEWAVAQRPLTGSISGIGLDQPGLNEVLTGEPRQFLRLDRVHKGLATCADEQGLLLPVIPQEILAVEVLC